MINHLYTHVSDSTYPYNNLGTEAWLMESVPKGAATLYLWQNDRTVVVGRNQNAWAECRVSELESDGGYLVRRLSGGGSVYHDTQNLNFTFLVNEEDYDVDKQLSVITHAVAHFGLHAVKTGRNDITIDDRKFSGNAFYRSAGKCYHHGTILVDVDTEAMGKYLKPSRAKLESKGIKSVKSRVVNLKDLAPDLTVEALVEALIKAFEEVYGLKSEPVPAEMLDRERISRLEEHFASWEWKFGHNVPFTFEAESRFPWGGVEVHLQVDKGIIRDAAIFSDAMDALLIESLPARLKGCEFSVRTFEEALAPGPDASEEQKQILQDITNLMTNRAESQAEPAGE